MIEPAFFRHGRISRSELIRPPEELGLNRLISVTGVTSAGKDFLLDSAAIPTVRALSYGTLLGQRLGRDRDAIRNGTSLDELKVAQQTVAEDLLADQPVVLSNHIVAKHSGVYIVNYDLERVLRPACYVVVTADPDEIMSRRRERNRLTGRTSEIETRDEIAFHQDLVVSTVLHLGESLGSGVAVLHNTGEMLDENIAAISEIVGSIL